MEGFFKTYPEGRDRRLIRKCSDENVGQTVPTGCGIRSLSARLKNGRTRHERRELDTLLDRKDKTKPLIHSTLYSNFLTRKGGWWYSLIFHKDLVN